jgi:uncharacterized protein (DUF2147 family)
MIIRINILKFPFHAGLVVLLLVISGFSSNVPASRLAGVWESEAKNLQMEMFEEAGYFSGKMLWFRCTTDSIMRAYRDTKNPDHKLNTRPLVGLKLVEQLTYKGDNIWGSGKIYDPNSGYTYDAQIQLIGPNTAIVRGYWKFKWFGKSMVFNRLK